MLFRKYRIYMIQNLHSFVNIIFLVAVLDELCDYILALICGFHLLLFSNTTV